MDHYDVLIIGAGPVGSHVACRLAGLGYRVAVLEEHEGIGDHVCCTGIISRECAQFAGINEVSDGCVLKVAHSARLFAPSGDFLRVSKDEVQAYILDRAAFDRCLAEKAERQGAEYFLASYVRDIKVSGDEVRVWVDQRGEVLTFRGRVAIIANGFASKLPEGLGLGQIKDFIIGAQTEVETNGISEVEVYFSQRIAPGFFAWLVPVSQHRARVGLFSREKPGAYLREFLAQLAAQGKISTSSGSGTSLTTCAEGTISYRGIPLKPLPRTYGDRVLVVGDAAGQVKPTTGGGIYYGLLCADMASKAVHEAFGANDFSRRKLAEYERLWKRKLGRELQIGYFARRLYNGLSDKRIEKIFSIIRDNNIHEALLDSPHFSFDRHGGLILDGLKRLAPWRYLLGKYSIPRDVL
ncbi:MAG: geranylgeranyl reductase family protein [Dehalococcoidia bacterium]|nr:Kynurenine 3-monooxygenase [Chloroflexota bacterium]MBT9159258.1 Kynurenine 3-monooxygenase [Chloroflexota bacterium]MBT9161642.1 Kynurenine 3-monooxygenase [Chloroflexota bacterium]